MSNLKDAPCRSSATPCDLLSVPIRKKADFPHLPSPKREGAVGRHQRPLRACGSIPRLAPNCETFEVKRQFPYSRRPCPANSDQQKNTGENETSSDDKKDGQSSRLFPAFLTVSNAGSKHLSNESTESPRDSKTANETSRQSRNSARQGKEAASVIELSERRAKSINSKNLNVLPQISINSGQRSSQKPSPDPPNNRVEAKSRGSNVSSKGSTNASQKNAKEGRLSGHSVPENLGPTGSSNSLSLIKPR